MLINYRIFIDSLLNGKTLKVPPTQDGRFDVMCKGQIGQKEQLCMSTTDSAGPWGRWNAGSDTGQNRGYAMTENSEIHVYN